MSEKKTFRPPPVKRGVPAGTWVKCRGCGNYLFAQMLRNLLEVCPKCHFHHRVSGMKRVLQLVDPNTFEPMDRELKSTDPLNFVDTVPYVERLERTEKANTGEIETGIAFIKGRKVVLCCMNYDCLGGSMGSAVGEKITRAIEQAMVNNLTLVIVSASGGARMQESVFSLLQMAKISATLGQFQERGGLYISILTDPTMGGTTASFAMLGDVILAEPKALIGFSGPRVIEKTIKERVPQEAQQSEALLENGFIDRIVHRKDLRDEISAVIDYCGSP